jgi:hypothetical protein
MKPGRSPRPSVERAWVSLALALILTLASLMASFPFHRCKRAPESASCAPAVESSYYSLSVVPLVLVAFASRLESAAALGIGVEQAPLAQR